jgi:hypothetical protein
MTLATPARLAALATAALLAATALPAAAQWAWRDDNGRVVYSDRAPPASVKPEQIVRQPSAPGVLSAPSPQAQSERTAQPATRSQAERELERKKLQQEQAEAARRNADEQARKQQLAQECERARGYLRTLEDGIRVVRTDAQGNREYLEDSDREREIRRTREQIGRYCQ